MRRAGGSKSRLASTIFGKEEVRGKVFGRNLRRSTSGKTKPGLIIGFLMVLIGFVLLAVDSSLFATWSWVNWSTAGIWSVTVLIVFGFLIAVWA